MGEMKTINVNARPATPGILMPLPDYDFDPTEAAIPWKVCTARGWRVAFSTDHGAVAQCDQRRLHDPLPGLIGASNPARAAYREMCKDPAYQHPVPYAAIDPGEYQALLLPGGDALRVRQYLESTVLQNQVLQSSRQGKLIGALCHGLLVLARTVDPETGHSILYGRKVTAIPRSLDRVGDLLGNKILRRGYIKYARYVADEVSACLEHRGDLSFGRSVLDPYVVSEDNFITSRWYNDADLFAERFAQALEQRMVVENQMA